MTAEIRVAPQDAQILEDLGRVLGRGPAKLLNLEGDAADLPEAIQDLLREIVQRLGDGRSLVLVPQNRDLTTQEAAAVLGVSRPFLIRLLNAGEIPYTLVGKHRRIALPEVLAYAGRRTTARRATLDRLAREAFAAGLYDQVVLPEGARDE